MNWLLESELFGEDEKPLIAALQKFGIAYTEVKFGTPYEKYIGLVKEPTVFHGSLQFGKLIQKNPSPIIVFCNLPNLECTRYYPYFGDHLLNGDYLMLPFGDLDRRKDWLFDTFSDNGEIFIRPSSGFKTFTGRTLEVNDWGKFKKEFVNYASDVNVDDITVVSQTKKVYREWRAVVVDDVVITGGQNKDHGKDVRVFGLPEEVHSFAQNVVGSVKYSPDSAWTIDICDCQDGFKVVEIGSFSCAGLYACDFEKVVEAIGSL